MYSCYSCYSILECFNLFSGVKLSISVLLYLFVHRLTRYFPHFGGCRAFFVYSCYSCYSILECFNLFSGVKLSISVLFYIFVHRLLDIFFILVGVKLSLCIVVIVPTLS